MPLPQRAPEPDDNEFFQDFLNFLLIRELLIWVFMERVKTISDDFCAAFKAHAALIPVMEIFKF
jgi:hypothetical protein